MRKNYLLSFLCFLLLSTSLFAQPTGWSYLRPLTVTEQSGATLTDYQVKFYFNTQAEISAGHMQASGDDIRFGTDCMGGTLLNYWIEGPMNDDSTIIWVKVPSIPANGSTTISMFYGNPSATSASAVAGTFMGPHSATDSVASGGAGGATLSQRGFRFAPTQDLLVTSFGKREPTGTTRYITLFNYATQAIINQIQVGGPAAVYSYGNLPSPIWLTQNTQYVLQLYQGASDGYYFGTSSQIGQHLTYYDMRYCNSCTQNTFPTNTLTNYHYGYPDLWYFTKQSVIPAPTAVVGAPGAFSVAIADPAGCSGDLVVLNPAIVGASGPTTCVWTNGAGLSDSTSCTPTLTVGSVGYYVLTVTDAAGCMSQDSVFVVNGTPSFSLNLDSTLICGGDTVQLVATGNADAYSWGPGTGLSTTVGNVTNASPTVSTAYVITALDSASGCTADETVQVDVVNVVLGLVIGPVNLCLGDSLQLSVSGADAYAWSPAASLSDSTGAIVQAGPDTTTQYMVTGYDTLHGCSGTAGLLVIVHPLPVVGFALADPDFCTTDSDLPLTFGTPTGGVYSGPFVSAGVFSPSTAGPGTYQLTYTYTDPNGCDAAATDTAIVSICIGTTAAMNVKLGVYPNPSTGLFTIFMGENPEAARYQVFNLMGQVLRTGDVGAGNTVLDLGEQPAGLYILTVETGGMRKNFNLEIRR